MNEAREKIVRQGGEEEQRWMEGAEQRQGGRTRGAAMEGGEEQQQEGGGEVSAIEEKEGNDGGMNGCISVGGDFEVVCKYYKFNIYINRKP